MSPIRATTGRPTRRVTWRASTVCSPRRASPTRTRSSCIRRRTTTRRALRASSWIRRSRRRSTTTSTLSCPWLTLRLASWAVSRSTSSKLASATHQVMEKQSKSQSQSQRQQISRNQAISSHFNLLPSFFFLVHPSCLYVGRNVGRFSSNSSR
ncbi:hypothetical protein AMAG_05956 [Allomyces macrogynus ATCC 38327]|uniref:Uncharacterized protein n=1 Tax=Allomyces macrogynus (strain ATCC 38327) TaxID=578462 RepID=A0A0L0SDL4_ALLM3|nr:hypothetical protein AMAG_05956 [Allomyces macrogynus ATCC 38327]|eukprot:KNE60576.1 hypothetical protein AMAG_05956 [Allomyces macrogynus ATCC 38327]